MTSFALHLPEQRKPARWLLAAIVIAAAHALLIAGAILWTRRTSPEPTILPAIAVTLAPVQSAAPQVQDQEDLPVGPEMQQADAAPPEPPKVEAQKPDDQMAPPPPAENAEAALPKPEPKQVEEMQAAAQPPAPETTAPPKNDRIGQFSEAASNAYNALVVGHLEKFKRYPAAAHRAVGKATLRFVLNRDGVVTDVRIIKSSGNAVLDQAALDIVHRASPFPKFPEAKPQAEAVYFWPMDFGVAH
ncbi:energy transducer TonB [Bradyrhizobium sp. SZCCHNS2096]|uniref:energy transducer TonB n=1 Tax=Bradyrhizobium sp. SZCCHNS2096 TaxID=3057309 RepID=UPI002916CFE9|nr:energy transducer TonB [Bradyrhizobium sp. SZCCHNS2096]